LPTRNARATLVTPIPFLAEFISGHADDVRGALEAVTGEDGWEVTVQARQDLLDVEQLSLPVD